ncbi:hypothetical protein DL95DRAFT_416208 [Leptodontidium sp. 2 PMI_412]|nr:hypothetical protein DL95DRAFT_416208 [Leptodontidium sp. 2 PMI_412]
MPRSPYANSIHDLYAAVGTLRRRSENLLEVESATLTMRATYTPGLIAWLGGKQKGLRPEEQYQLAVFNSQWRNLKELVLVHKSATAYLQTAIRILGTMNSTLGAISTDIIFYVQANRRHGNSWAFLGSEMRKLKPVLDDLESVRGDRASEKRKITTMWSDRWDHCVKQKRAAKDNELDMGWENCLFEPDFLMSQLYSPPVQDRQGN